MNRHMDGRHREDAEAALLSAGAEGQYSSPTGQAYPHSVQGAPATYQQHVQLQYPVPSYQQQVPGVQIQDFGAGPVAVLAWEDNYACAVLGIILAFVFPPAGW